MLFFTKKKREREGDRTTVKNSAKSVSQATKTTFIAGLDIACSCVKYAAKLR